VRSTAETLVHVESNRMKRRKADSSIRLKIERTNNREFRSTPSISHRLNSVSYVHLMRDTASLTWIPCDVVARTYSVHHLRPNKLALLPPLSTNSRLSTAPRR